MSSAFAVMNTNGIAQSISTIGMCVLAVSRQEVQTMQNNMQSVETAIEEQEKQIFNQKFEMYKGKQIRGNLVKNLISNVIMSNIIENNEKKVTIRLEGSKINKPSNWSTQGESEDEKLSELENIIKESEEYNVDMEYNTKGLVNIITITEN